MVISLAADELTGIAEALPEELGRRGHQVIRHGALATSIPASSSQMDDASSPEGDASPEGEGERTDWAWASERVARDVAEGRADQGIVCCWTGTGASIAANKVPGVRAALCADAATAAGARRWNDANVLALSLRATSAAELVEILDAWLSSPPSSDAQDLANVQHLAAIERR